MTTILAGLTGLVVMLAMLIGLKRGRDPLCPMTMFGPMLLFTYVWTPITLDQSGALEPYYPHGEGLRKVMLVNFICIAAFCIGATRKAVPRRATGGLANLNVTLTPASRRRLLGTAVVLGLMANAAFLFMIEDSGGWGKVFSRAKPYLRARSGYLGELPMLAYPAVLLYAISQQGRTLSPTRIAAVLLLLVPHLTMATLGGRRGPAFYSLAVIGISTYIIRARAPSWKAIITGTIGVGLLLLFLVSNRRNLYVGSEEAIDLDRFSQTIFPTEVEPGHEFVFGSGLINTADSSGQFNWGLRYVVLLFVRPIPRAIWPTKYSDLGLQWLVDRPGVGAFTESEWDDAVGFVPTLGSAGGFVADMYIEFAWLAVVPLLLIGLLYSVIHSRSRTRGGLWTLLYLELLLFSVHLPSQSVQSWLYRVILLCVPTALLWRWFAGRGGRRLRPSPKRPTG